MSAAVINRNLDLKRLQDEGYELEVREGCAIVYHVPYLDSTCTVQYSTLVSPLAMNGTTVRVPNTHVMYMQGSIPYHKAGSRMDAVYHSPYKNTFAGIPVDSMLSNKPQSGYRDYYQKFTAYIHALSAEAQAVDPTVTAATFKRVVSSDDSVLCYADTNSSRGAIMDTTDKFKGQRIGIIGLGGTGSYLLDQIAKTPVAEIHLFDGDVFCQHNAFRAPGAPSIEVFSEQPYKTDYFKSIYGNMHRGIHSHPYRLDENNVGELSSLDFVFLAMDSGVCKRIIVNFLLEQRIAFIDTGINISRAEDSLIGMARVTASQGGDERAIEKYVSFDEVEPDLYQTNIQTADLNAFCALGAVMQWKKSLGFYKEDIHFDNCVYTTNDGEFNYGSDDI